MVQLIKSKGFTETLHRTEKRHQKFRSDGGRRGLDNIIRTLIRECMCVSRETM